MSSSKKKSVSQASSLPKKSQELVESERSKSTKADETTDTTTDQSTEVESTSPELAAPPARPAEPKAPRKLEVVKPDAVKASASLETPADPPSSPSDSETNGVGIQQPISPPSEPLQYRAIGLLQGIYEPSEEQFNRGTLITREGLQLDAVLLGQVMSLVKKYLDLSLPHLWVVYPRTRESEPMHVQLVGVWSPTGFGGESADENGDEPNAEALQASLSPLESLQPPLQDGFFSIRGQVIQQSVEEKMLFVKIQQTSRKKTESPKAFKVKLSGDIPQKPMGYFWDFEVIREGENLKIEKATPIAFIPMKKKKGPPKKGDRPPRKPFKRSGASTPRPATAQKKPAPTPSKPAAAGSPPPKRPLPKIIKAEEQ